ncbi:MAG: ATP synthase F0 subunit C [Candidatus Omnitrophica bacterium]|nr:ATP synthase F0 subunit C [Candidatus Omnitrophota bacterium]
MEITGLQLGKVTAGLGLGLVAIGAGIGVGQVIAAAIGGVARQPEASNKIQSMMFIGAALIEGVALICAIFCFMALQS